MDAETRKALEMIAHSIESHSEAHRETAKALAALRETNGLLSSRIRALEQRDRQTVQTWPSTSPQIVDPPVRWQLKPATWWVAPRDALSDFMAVLCANPGWAIVGAILIGLALAALQAEGCP